MCQMQRLPRWQRNSPAKQKMQIWSLSQEDHLGKEIETHSSILAWETPWTEEPGGLQPRGLKEADTAEQTHTETNTTILQ